MFQPEIEAIDLQLVRHDVHQPFDQVRRFGSAGAAVRVGRHLVRVDADDLEPDRRNLVAAREHEARERRHGRREQLQVRAEIGNRRRLQSEDSAVVLHRYFVVADLIAAMNRGGGVLAARLDPLHWRAQAHREMRAQRLFGVHVQLRAEPAADFRRHDAQLRFGDAEHVRQQRPQQMRDLRRRPQRQRPFAAVVGRDDGARLDRHRRQPLMIETVLDDPVGVPERRVDVAAAVHDMRERDVGAHVRMRQRRSALQRFHGVDDGRQRVVVDEDELGGVQRGCVAVRHHHRDRLAGKAHSLPHEERTRRLGREAAVALRQLERRRAVIEAFAGGHGVARRFQIGDGCRARHRAARIVDVGAGEDRDDARNGFRGRGLDAADARVRMRTAQDARVQQTGEPEIVGVGAESLDEARILDALHRTADVRSRVRHGRPPSDATRRS